MALTVIEARRAAVVAEKAQAVGVLCRDLAQAEGELGGRFLLFGSAARGALRPESDVDLLLDFADGAASEAALARAEAAAEALGLRCDALSIRGLEPGFLAHVLLEARPVSEHGRDAVEGDVMSSGRWFEVDRDVADAVLHFGHGVELYAEGGLERTDRTGYVGRMAFMHAMQSGHTSMESALVRVLKLCGEEVPGGEQWHADLIRRVAAPVAGRPAVLRAEVAAWADRTRAFRHVAMRSYAHFDVALARPAVEAAAGLVGALPAAVDAFRRAVDR